MTATVTVRAYTGTDAGTESAALDEVTLISEDAVTGDPVAPGTTSYERWIALRVDVAPSMGVTNFWVQNTGDLPDGVALRFGVADTPATPVNTASPVATKELTSGQRFIFDVDTYTEAGEKTRYLVIQEIVASDADTGEIPEQALRFGWAER